MKIQLSHASAKIYDLQLKVTKTDAANKELKQQLMGSINEVAKLQKIIASLFTPAQTQEVNSKRIKFIFISYIPIFLIGAVLNA